jgi:hypothetical protein
VVALRSPITINKYEEGAQKFGKSEF